MSTLEEQLGTYFDALGAGVLGAEVALSSYPVERVAAATRPRRRRRRQAVLVAASIVSVTASLVGMAVWMTGDDDAETPVVSVVDGEVVWSELPLSAVLPIVHRTANAASMEDLLIWGGDDEGGSPGRDTGALVDLDSGEVIETSPAPLGRRSGARAAVVGERFVILGGADIAGVRTDGAIYDPHSDEWQSFGPAPIEGPPGYLSQAVSAGDDVAALMQFGSGREQDVSNGWRICVFDVEDLAWTGCVPVDVTAEHQVALASNGTDVVVVADSNPGSAPGPQFTAHRLSLDSLDLTPIGEGAIPGATTDAGAVPVADSLASASLQGDGTLVVWGHQETAAVFRTEPAVSELAAYQLPLRPTECPLSAVSFPTSTYLAGCDLVVFTITADSLESSTPPATGELVASDPTAPGLVMLSSTGGGLSVWRALGASS